MRYLLLLLLPFLFLGCVEKESDEVLTLEIPRPEDCVQVFKKVLYEYEEKPKEEGLDCPYNVSYMTRYYLESMKGWSTSLELKGEHLSTLIFYKELDDRYLVVTVTVKEMGKDTRVILAWARTSRIPETGWV